ncbi:MAG: hypothetical protein GPJ11_24370 [Microcystis aeruginosa L211-101]|nr:hypothetical protein [Microcystis aeruginosa L211-11]NCR33833.1 hypothetical protein [Microcystis aeruginosa L211-101]
MTIFKQVMPINNQWQERSDCLDCQGVTQKTIKELLSNLKSQARKKRSKN